MANRCATCASPMVAIVNSMLEHGRPDTLVARIAGLTRDSVRGHRTQGHVVPETPPPVAPVASTPDPIADVAGAVALIADTSTPEEQIRVILADLNAMDMAKMSPASKLDLLEAKRRAVDTLAKHAAPPVPLDDGRPSWEYLRELEALTYGALTQFPDARKALSDAYRARLALPSRVEIPYAAPAYRPPPPTKED